LYACEDSLRFAVLAWQMCVYFLKCKVTHVHKMHIKVASDLGYELRPSGLLVRVIVQLLFYLSGLI
jgi:hypothetical protein